MRQLQLTGLRLLMLSGLLVALTACPPRTPPTATPEPVPVGTAACVAGQATGSQILTIAVVRPGMSGLPVQALLP